MAKVKKSGLGANSEGSAFETNTEGSAFETNTNSSAFETNVGSAFETSGQSSVSGATARNRALYPDAFELVDDMNVTYVLHNEVELKSQGAMGKVSSAIWIDGKSERKVLLKRRYKPIDANEERLFSNEGIMSRDYGSGSIVRTYCKGETDEFLFIMMEFYEGETLDNLIEQGIYQGKIDATVKLVRGILSGLAELHGSEIVHRDLKPANIMVRKNGSPVILDLGLACQASISDVAGLSKIGTPKYAAPEQLHGDFSCASDIYSLGKIFLETYTGSLDVDGVESIPETYREFVEKCLKDNPGERFATAEEALQALNMNDMMGRSSVVITANNIEKLKEEIAKKYGDDGILDEQEKSELRSMANAWNISKNDLDVFIDAAYNDIKKFRMNNIVGYLLQKSGYSKQSVMSRARKLHLETPVVMQWIEETPAKLEQIAAECLAGNKNRVEELLKETPVNPNWMNSILETYGSNVQVPVNKKSGQGDGGKKQKKKSKGGCLGCLGFILGVLLILSIVFIDDIEDSLIYNGVQYDEITDARDGQKYRVREIGGVVWMAENLRFNANGSWCEKCERYGRLYTWDAAVSACPDGWMLPTVDLWNDLFTAVGTVENAGKNLKSTYKWDDDGNGTNTVGFAALPAGFYSIKDAAVKKQGTFTRWWTYTAESLEKALRVRIDGDSANVRIDPIATGYGLSVRCVHIDDKKVRKLSGPQLLNSREYVQASGRMEKFTNDGRPIIRKPKARRTDTLDVRYGNDATPILFMGADVDWVRMFEKSFVKSAEGKWDTLRYWVYDSLHVVGNLDLLAKKELEENRCDVLFDGLMGNAQNVSINMGTACSKLYEGMPYKIDAKYRYRLGGEDYCEGCSDVLVAYDDLQVDMVESDDMMVDARDGRVYPLVKIGKQIWMARNLYYKDSSSASTVCYNNAEECEELGYLYDYSAAKKVCPEGFRLPSNSDWNTLTETLGSSAVVKMKATTHWYDGFEGNNSSGFSALPTGYYQAGYEDEKSFFLEGEYAGWWSSTPDSDGKAFVQNAIRNQAAGISGESKTDGYSVRCLRVK